MAALGKRIRTDRALLKDHPDELGYFDRNMNTVEDYFGRNPHQSGSLCLFVCWLLDFFEIHALPVSLPDLLWVDLVGMLNPGFPISASNATLRRSEARVTPMLLPRNQWSSCS